MAQIGIVGVPCHTYLLPDMTTLVATAAVRERLCNISVDTETSTDQKGELERAFRLKTVEYGRNHRGFDGMGMNPGLYSIIRRYSHCLSDVCIGKNDLTSKTIYYITSGSQDIALKAMYLSISQSQETRQISNISTARR